MFGMGTGGSLQPSPLNYLLFRISYPDNCIKSIFLNVPSIPGNLLRDSLTHSESTGTSFRPFPVSRSHEIRSKRFSQFCASLSLLQNCFSA